MKNNRETRAGGRHDARVEQPAQPGAYSLDGLNNARILRLKQVAAMVGLAKTSIYRKIQEGTFPSPIKLGGARASGWLSTEVVAWIEYQVRRSRGA
jgi:prophage regulatory protein